MKTFWRKYRIIFYTILGIAGVFLLWLIIASCLKTTLFPGPIKTFAHLFTLLGESTTYEAIGKTILSLLISVAISFLVGVLFGVFGGVFEPFRAFFKPFITVTKTIPTAAVVFILVVLLKPMYAAIIVSSLITFPIIYEAVVTGFTSLDTEIVEAMKVDNTPLILQIFRVYLPLSYRHILLGCAQIFGLGMKVTIMAEVLTATGTEINVGAMIYYHYQFAEMLPIFAYSLIAIFLIGITDIGLYFAKKKLKENIK